MVVTELKYSNNLDSSEFDAIVIGKSLLHSHLQFSKLYLCNGKLE